MRDNLNVKNPLDGPLWRVYAQDYNPVDCASDLSPPSSETDVDSPTPKQTKGFTAFKAHHALCDGISIMCLSLAMSEEYSRDYFVKSNDAKWYEEIFVKLMALKEIPKVLSYGFLRNDKNFITKRRNELSGDLNIHSSKLVDFRLLKALSKTIGVTINDIVLSSLSTSMN